MPASFPLGKDVHGLNGAQPATPTWSLAEHGHLSLCWGHPSHKPTHGATWASCPDGDIPTTPSWRNMGHLPCWGHTIMPSCHSVGGSPTFFLFWHLLLSPAWRGPTLHSKWIDVAEIFFWAVLYPCAKCPPLGGRDPSHVSGVQGGLCTQRNWQGYQSTVAHSHATLSQQVRMP